jgi:hypothetical protein
MRREREKAVGTCQSRPFFLEEKPPRAPLIPLIRPLPFEGLRREMRR